MRRLGQHFLKNQEVLRKIASALEISEADTVIEIGPGHGELTRHILDRKPERLIAIEKDKGLAIKLADLFPNLEVVLGDALEELPSIANDLEDDYKLCGNIPYYISGYLFRTIESLPKKPTLSVFTVQKEVAERIAAEPPKMNLLAASVRFWAEPKIVSFVSKKDFSPAPKVDSAVILLKARPTGSPADRENYYPFVKALFKQPRKTVLNNLSSLETDKEKLKEKLEKQGIDPSLRGQDLSFSQILELSRVFAE
jgi:16S rRNA (adenine1518-N6/adenine1519-N6)-dimethyltransferase